MRVRTDSDRTVRIAFMSGAKTDIRVTGLPEVHEVFHDRVEMWRGYPLTKEAIPHRPTLYFVERCRLAELLQEMHDLIFSNDQTHETNVREFAVTVDDLAAKMRLWYQRLPFELQYEPPFSIAVTELQSVGFLDLS